MALDHDDLAPRKPKNDIVLGADLSTHSVTELEHLVALLKQEILRVEEAMAARDVTRAAAENIFKR